MCCCVNKNACIGFEAHTRLKFAANVRNDQNVGFLLKRESKNDNEARKGVKVVASMMKAKASKGKASVRQA